MMNIPRKLMVAVAAAVVVSGVNAQGIPVYDNAQNIQMMMQVANTVKQLAEMARQYQVLSAQLDAVRGGRGMELLMSREVRNYMPDDWKGIQDLAVDGVNRYSDIANKIKNINGNNAVYSAKQMADLPADMQAMMNRSRNIAATRSALAETAYGAATQRFNSLQSMVTAVGTTQDAKAAADLQARVAAEQAMLQNEAIKLAQATQLQEADEKLFNQQKMERMMQMSGSTLSASSVSVKVKQ